MSPLRKLLAVAGVALFCAPLAAHSPYLLPNQFDVSQRDHVTVQASFADRFFVPDVVMKAEAYQVQQPDGSTVMLKPVYLRDLALLEADTKLSGTYRFSTGIRTGRTAKAALKDRSWEFFGEGEPAPAGAKGVYDMTSITCAEVYISKGSPTDTAVKIRGKGLEFALHKHPNRLLAGDRLNVIALFHGKPVPDLEFSLVQARLEGTSESAAKELRSDAGGKLSVLLAEPGIYHLQARHRFVVDEAAKRAESHTYALTLEVTE